MPKRLTDEQRGPLGARLYHARLDAGLEQRQMAEGIGISIGSYTKWEIGKTDRPDIAHLRKAAEMLGVELPWLLTGEQTVSSDEIAALRADVAAMKEALDRYLAEVPKPD